MVNKRIDRCPGALGGARLPARFIRSVAVSAAHGFRHTAVILGADADRPLWRRRCGVRGLARPRNSLADRGRRRCAVAVLRAVDARLLAVVLDRLPLARRAR